MPPSTLVISSFFFSAGLEAAPASGSSLGPWPSGKKFSHACFPSGKKFSLRTGARRG